MSCQEGNIKSKYLREYVVETAQNYGTRGQGRENQGKPARHNGKEYGKRSE